MATGAARLLEQKRSTPDQVAAPLTALVEDAPVRMAMQTALAQWHAPHAAERIAGIMLEKIALSGQPSGAKASGGGAGSRGAAEAAPQVLG